jgi:hypothetical protein
MRDGPDSCTPAEGGTCGGRQVWEPGQNPATLILADGPGRGGGGTMVLAKNRPTDILQP